MGGMSAGPAAHPWLLLASAVVAEVVGTMALLGAVLFAESLGPIAFLGIGLMIVGVVLIQTGAPRHTRAQDA